MDWIPILVGAIGGAVGGAFGSLFAAPFQSRGVKSAITVTCVIIAIQVARLFVTPWAEIEYLFYNPPPDIQSLVQMAPDHIEELKADLRQAYRNGGAPADFQKAGYAWGRKYAAVSFMSLMASKNAALALESFTRYLSVFKAVYTHDPVTCYDWVEGIGTPTNEQLGIGATEQAVLQKMMADRAQLAKPENAALTGQKLPLDLEKAVIAQVQNKWDRSRLDFQDTSAPTPTLAPEKRAAVCYTTFALFSEIQTLPPEQRLQYLRGMFGAN